VRASVVVGGLNFPHREGVLEIEECLAPGDVLLMGPYLGQVRNLNFHLSHVGQLEAMNKLLQTTSGRTRSTQNILF
jgi:hypothetical protein